MRTLGLLLTVVLLVGCTRPPANHQQGSAAISVVDERLSLSPLLSEAVLERLEGWPADQSRQEVIMRNFSQLWNRLRSELRRCEKLGYYKMVEDAEHPTVRISLTVLAYDFVDDTLSMPVRLLVERLPDGQRFIYTIPARAYAPPELKTQKPFHYAAQLLADYRRQFPYRSVVSFFYPHDDDI